MELNQRNANNRNLFMNDNILTSCTRHTCHHNALVIVVCQTSGIARAGYAGIDCHGIGVILSRDPHIIDVTTLVVGILIHKAVSPRSGARKGCCQLRGSVATKTRATGSSRRSAERPRKVGPDTINCAARHNSPRDCRYAGVRHASS